ncbi:DoxX family protein [Streptomyces indicus]|uniref:DoxX-like family protein n=1 Tax=Streptomyces indicus TaxID=417292 RepID=A0A1G8WKI3_9ACTN|nr:DoxX family protein [Streptomyces indicus]SDJ78839.1 DoxX-like family protein [Streptomyces indicus]
MYAAYLVLTLVTAAATGFGAYLDFTRHPMIVAIANRLRVPVSWMLPLGTCLAAGSLGLLAGLAVRPLGVAAAAGLVLYFVGAVITHLRVGDLKLGGALLFLGLSAATLALALTAPH